MTLDGDVCIIFGCLTINRWWLWWFSQLYQWFLHLKQMMILMIQSAQGERKKNKTDYNTSLHHTDADRTRKRTGENCTAKLILFLNPNRNGTVWYLAVSTHALGPVHSGEWGGRGAGSESFVVFASSIMWHVWHLVWHTDSEHSPFCLWINTWNDV